MKQSKTNQEGRPGPQLIKEDALNDLLCQVKSELPESADVRCEPENDLIARRAYEIYESRGRMDGLALTDWLQAERELSRADDR